MKTSMFKPSPDSFRVNVVTRWPRRHVRHTYNVPMAVAIAHKLKLNTTEHFTGLTGSPLSRKFSAIFHFPARERLFLDLSWSVNIKMFIGKAKTKLTFNNFSVITVVKSSVSTWDGYPVGNQWNPIWPKNKDWNGGQNTVKKEWSVDW